MKRALTDDELDDEDAPKRSHKRARTSKMRRSESVEPVVEALQNVEWSIRTLKDTLREELRVGFTQVVDALRENGPVMESQDED